MKVGFHLPQWGADATRQGVLSVARTVEDCGLDSVWVADHIVMPVNSNSQYPYAESTSFTPETGFLDALTVLSVAAGATERVNVGTSVLVLPLRHPIAAAKAVATLDVLSGGRAILAVGAGWLEEEFVALDQRFPQRGKRFDEQIRIARRLWADGVAEFTGDFYQFGSVACEPRPLQVGGPPLLIGGMGPAAWQRAAALGDGWHAVGVHEDALVEGMREVGARAEALGRDPSEITLSTSTVLASDDETTLRRLSRLHRLGATHVVLDTGAADADGTCRRIEHFATSVLPRLREQAGPASQSNEIVEEE